MCGPRGKQPAMTNGSHDSSLKATEFFHLSVFAFGSTAFGTSLGVVVLPVLVLAVAPEDFKNTYLGVLSLVGLIVAMVIQPLAGHISDDTTSHWGRRVPYVVAGSLLACLSVVVLARIHRRRASGQCPEAARWCSVNLG